METGVQMAIEAVVGIALVATIGNQARSRSPQPANSRRSARCRPERAVLAPQQEDAVEVAHRLGFVRDDDGQRVEPVLGIDREQGVARLLDALADVALQLGPQRQVEDRDERDDGQREQDCEGPGEAHGGALAGGHC